MLVFELNDDGWEMWRNGARTRLWGSALRGATGTTVNEQILAPGSFVPVHWHYSDEVLGFLRGTIEVEVDGEKKICQAPFVVVVPPHKHHGFKNVGDEESWAIGAFNWPFHETYYSHDEQGVFVRDYEAQMEGARRRLPGESFRTGQEWGESV